MSYEKRKIEHNTELIYQYVINSDINDISKIYNFVNNIVSNINSEIVTVPVFRKILIEHQEHINKKIFKYFNIASFLGNAYYLIKNRTKKECTGFYNVIIDKMCEYLDYFNNILVNKKSLVPDVKYYVITIYILIYFLFNKNKKIVFCDNLKTKFKNLNIANKFYCDLDESL